MSSLLGSHGLEQRGVFELVGLAPASLVETALCGRASGLLVFSVVALARGLPWAPGLRGLPAQALSITMSPSFQRQQRQGCLQKLAPLSSPCHASFLSFCRALSGGQQDQVNQLEPHAPRGPDGQGLMGPALPVELRAPDRAPWLSLAGGSEVIQAGPYVYIVTGVGGQL